MNEIVYIGESLWQGTLGHIAVLIAFTSAAFGSYALLRAPFDQDSPWLRLGRIYFAMHGLAVFTIIGLLITMMIQGRLEYAYVWEHVSEDLPMRYIFTAFWEGQEGSFLLWMFWHVILGTIILTRSGKWQGPVLGFLLAVQCVITSMILGIYLAEDIRIGVTPFALLRETMQAPIFARADYLNLIEGNGLNPLLQNYWMTIHPPTLFLGFASVTVPFCFAMAGLLTGKHKEWLRPAMPWALFSAGILGTGILMGGAWAYEALSFGGYWAWDPVENMSLVPWLVLLAAVHSNIISVRTGHSIRNTYIFYLLAFLLILYSSFLTRSGVLGDTSAHAFTQMGLEWQLVGFIAIFTFWAGWLIAKNWRGIPAPSTEEALASRELWMFVGTLVLAFSAVLITFTTSIPVYNKILDVAANIAGTDYSHLHRTAPIEPVAHYNKFQLWIAVFIGVLSGLAQFLRYKEQNWVSYRGLFLKHLTASLLAAAALTAALAAWINISAWQYWVLMGCGAFAITANIDYLAAYGRQHTRRAASSLAHLGFGVMIIGIMASGLNKHVISVNSFAQQGLVDGLDPRKHVALIQGRPMFMSGYWVEYEKDTVVNNVREFKVTYKQMDENQDTIASFTVLPNVIFNNKATKVEATNPSTKHYLSKDIFTYVAALPGEQMDVEEARRINDTLQFTPIDIVPGDTLETDEYQMWIESISTVPTHPEYHAVPGDLTLDARFGIHNKGRNETISRDVMVYLRDGLIYGFPAQINDLNMRIRMSESAIRMYYVPESELNYEEVSLKPGQLHHIKGANIRFAGVTNIAQHPRYFAEPDDIAVTAVLNVNQNEEQFEARPIFYIRGNEPATIKDFNPISGTHIRLNRIDPASETFHFSMAVDGRPRDVLPIEVARNVPRTDLIVIEAIVFPGINLFWLGCILMMIGLFIGMWQKHKEDRV